MSQLKDRRTSMRVTAEKMSSLRYEPEIGEQQEKTAVYKEYFCVITTYKQYQVIRFFYGGLPAEKGSPANYFIIEAVQCWMNKEGKTETLSLLRGMSIFYYDAWIYGSSLELRKRNVHHDRIYDICPGSYLSENESDTRTYEEWI